MSHLLIKRCDSDHQYSDVLNTQMCSIMGNGQVLNRSVTPALGYWQFLPIEYP